MKTVVIIENEAVELAAIVSLFEQWQKELNILTAKEEKAAITIMARHHVDLVVCDLAIPNTETLESFSLLTRTYPYIPCIALSAQPGTASTEATRRGACHCLEKPIFAEELLEHAANLLNTDTCGTIRGIPVHNFLQMLESEEKTCTLQVDHKNDTGRLYFQNGQLVSAETQHLLGEKAAHLILSWQETVLQVRHFNGQRKRQINKPILLIILEAFRLSRGKEKEKEPQDIPSAKDHRVSLKHLPTLGKRIPLEIGFSVKMEFPHLETFFESVVVGMLLDQYLILTNPQPLADIDASIHFEQRIIIEYVHKGRVWMFKVQLLKTVEAPYQLLIFEYPAVIHYHELRQSKRSSIFIPCTFHLPEEPELYGTLLNLSTTGALCQIRHKTELPMPQIDIAGTIMLRCLMPGLKEEQIFNGNIRNLTIDAAETRIGIEFTNLQPHLAETIGDYLFAIDGANE